MAGATKIPRQLLLLASLASGAAAFRLFQKRPSRTKAAASAIREDDSPISYDAPKWLPEGIGAVPSQRLQLASLPTPIHRWKVGHAATKDVCVYIKRDDMTGCEFSGNKIRKLEFLLADALAQGADSVITVGGIQSNHCRATAAAARRVGLEPHIILRAEDPSTDPGTVGNLLVDRMVGAKMHLVGPEEFSSKGGWTLVCELKAELEAQHGKKPYPFPSGGSNDVGTWGYVEAIAEIQRQAASSGMVWDRIYFACGSGGTGAGLALGMKFSGLAETTELVGLCVDDTPGFFYEKIDKIYADLGVNLASASVLRLEDNVGLGYAQSTDEELAFILNVAQDTGVVLDPVYSGKAVRGMIQDLERKPLPPGAKVLFIHTGGLLGVYAKAPQLAPLLPPLR